MRTEEAPIEGLHRPLRWWREVLYILVMYAIYSAIRNLFGSAAVSPARALQNAENLIGVERALGLFHEQSIQDWFLPHDAVVRFWNIFYGTFHFVVTAAALIWMYHSFPWRYAAWRNTLAIMTGLALIGFALFPLMPPRLLNVPTCGEPIGPHADLSQDCSDYGGGSYAEEHYGFVDTLKEVGGLWSFDSGAVAEVSNQYAAMPSLHIGWSVWVTLVVYPQLRRWWSRAIAIAYPLATLLCIMLTANHYWIDGVGGLVVLGTGWALGSRLARLRTPRRVPEDEPATMSPAG